MHSPIARAVTRACAQTVAGEGAMSLVVDADNLVVTRAGL